MSEFDYRKFLTENKLTKVSRGRETGKAQILSEGIQIREGFDMDVDTEMDEANAPSKYDRQYQDHISGLISNEVKRTVNPRNGVWYHLSLSTRGNHHDLYCKWEDGKATNIYIGYGNGEVSLDSVSVEGEPFDMYLGQIEEDLGWHKGQWSVIESNYVPEKDSQLDEANAQKDAYFKRKEREKRGNWGGSVGAFVEKHGEDLGRVGTNRQALVDYIETTMKPELNDEAKAYVDNLVATTKSSFRLLQALYNATMAGSGLSTGAGSLREEDWEGDDSLYESISASKKYPQEKGSRTSVTSKKYKGKKAGDGQDRMAKSEMTGEKIDVTIGGVTKSISTREYKKYRKMTDSEEKKAWKKKYGFVK